MMMKRYQNLSSYYFFNWRWAGKESNDLTLIFKLEQGFLMKIFTFKISCKFFRLKHFSERKKIFEQTKAQNIYLSTVLKANKARTQQKNRSSKTSSINDNWYKLVSKSSLRSVTSWLSWDNYSSAIVMHMFMLLINTENFVTATLPRD